MRKGLATFSLVIWMVIVYAFHYSSYYGPRLVRFVQQWLP